MVIGGIAIIARGVNRLTTDIDVVIRGDAVAIDALLELLAEHDIEPRIADAAAFARRNLVLLVRHQATGVDLDCSLAFTRFEHEALSLSERGRFGSVRAPMATPEDLMILKVMAGRPKDIEDAAALLVLFPRIDRERVRRELATLAELAEEPGLVDNLRLATERARAPRTKRRKTAPRRRGKS